MDAYAVSRRHVYVLVAYKMACGSPAHELSAAHGSRACELELSHSALVFSTYVHQRAHFHGGETTEVKL